MYENIVQPIENLAGNLIDRVTGWDPRGAAPAPRQASGRQTITLPRDLYAHADVQTEWWYYTGHCRTVSGRRFGFELVFFKRRTDSDRLGVLPVRLLANPVYAAHFAVTDIDEKRFRYEHRKSFNRSFDMTAAAAEDRYFLRLGDWTVRESAGGVGVGGGGGRHILRAALKNGLTFEAALESAKPAVLNGHEGVSLKDESEASYHFSFTRMNVEGEIAGGGGGRRPEKFHGSAWMDREFGTWRQKNWDWFSIQLDDGSELMIYQFRNEQNQPTQFSHGSFVDRAGRSAHLKSDEFAVRPTGFWKSPKTKTVYPSGWQVSVPRFGVKLRVEPSTKNQELDTRGTTMIVYWEGACRVEGESAGRPASGRAYTELVGYNRWHENPSLGKFLLGFSVRKDWHRILL